MNVYLLLSFSVNSNSLPLLSMMVMEDDPYPLSGFAVRVTVVPLEADFRLTVTVPPLESGTVMLCVASGGSPLCCRWSGKWELGWE